MIIATSAALAFGGVLQDGVPRRMAEVARPASTDVAPYLQTTAIRDETPKPDRSPSM